MFKTPGITIMPTESKLYVFDYNAKDLTIELNNYIAHMALRLQYCSITPVLLSEIEQELASLASIMEMHGIVAPHMTAITTEEPVHIAILVDPDTLPVRRRNGSGKQNDSKR
jgi:hypothetical protein